MDGETSCPLVVCCSPLLVSEQTVVSAAHDEGLLLDLDRSFFPRLDRSFSSSSRPAEKKRSRRSPPALVLCCCVLCKLLSNIPKMNIRSIITSGT